MMFASDSKNVCRHLPNTYKFKIILWVKARPLLLFFTSNVHFSLLIGKMKRLRVGTCQLKHETLL